MIQLFISALIISLVNGEKVSLRPIQFINISSVIAWSDKLFEKGAEFLKQNETLKANAITFDETVINELTEISIELDTYLQYMSAKQKKRLVTKHINREFSAFDIAKIDDNINIVERYYSDIQTFNMQRKLMRTTVQHFTNTILWGADSLPNVLQETYQIVFPSIHYATPGVMQNIIDDAEKNIQDDCDKYTSTQQHIFFIYMSILITEMKGLTILTHAYLLLSNLDENSNYITELKIAYDKFQTRVKNYNKHIKADMSLSQRVIYRCEVDLPQRGVHFLEFIRYNRILLINKSVLGMGNDESQSEYSGLVCEDIPHNNLEKILKMQIPYCKTIALSRDIETCSAGSNSTRRYLWWRSGYNTYGSFKPCPKPPQLGNGDYPYLPTIKMCACSLIDLDPVGSHKIVKFSVEAQISDTKNNMVVVGVKFVVHDNAIHLQIQQSKLLPGQIHGIDNSTVWKALDEDELGVKREMGYLTLSDYSGGLRFDDVILPPKYVVTGVRIDAQRTPPTGFFLQVHGTPYDWKTGELNRKFSDWFSPGDYDYSTTSDNEKNRIRIKTDDLDDPVKCNKYNYDPAINKIIQFSHSSMKKDAGQSTIPYIDAQPVETYPPFPLSGIGLFYRQKTGCGGYIAPQIFTIDISKY